jgi:hypothetical protein
MEKATRTLNLASRSPFAVVIVQSDQMPDAPPGRPTRSNSSSQIREQLQVYLLLPLGIGLLGAGTAAFG